MILHQCLAISMNVDHDTTPMIGYLGAWSTIITDASLSKGGNKRLLTRQMVEYLWPQALECLSAYTMSHSL